MLEWFAATTGVELGKLVLEQVLDLSKPVLEGYVQDFFKDCLSSGVSRLNATALKTPMAEAVGYFIKRFIKELQINDVPETSIQHHYKAAIKKFMQDKAVRPILGKAFEKDCKQIDCRQLEQIWVQQYQVAGWQFPSEEFDWRGICKEYVYEVKGIVRTNPELRSLLETLLFEDIARNTAQLSPGFDVEAYRASLQSSYGYLKLYTLDSTDRTDAIKLWAMFIEQTVREALPPMRYDLPLDLKRQLQAEGQLEADLSPEALAHYRREYFQQPARKVLEAVADSHRAVILGDPGSGKSSLLQYLALEWVEGKTKKLPLLIELREFAIKPSVNFLEFLHQGRGVDWHFDQQQLHQHLIESPTLVMFDGLDEVFDRATQSTVIDDIIRFSQQYPKAQVLVTSRIIGYNPDRLQHSGFRHFTIQSLNIDEIHEFIDRWYDLSMGSDPDKARLKQRLKDAIALELAIANLADNPLLLTMMAILNRRQELPHDRADLYDQASRVLLYHWDVDHKRLQIPMDAIGRREKQEMLRLIAYEMQAGEEGLKGNLISAERLTRILTDYLRDQGFSEPREKVNRLIQQLRERNFILCYRGADTYGFMHRTFLEYFCAVEIVHRFEKQRTLTFEQLRDKVFGQHWQDETWREVLRLICGAIDPKFANDLLRSIPHESFSSFDRPLGSLFIAECLSEIDNSPITEDLRHHLISEAHYIIYFMEGGVGIAAQGLFMGDAHFNAFDVLSKLLEKDPDALTIFQSIFEDCDRIDDRIGVEVIKEFAKRYEDSRVYPFIQRCTHHNYDMIRSTALDELVRNWKEEPNTLALTKEYAQTDASHWVRRAAIVSLGQKFQDDLDVLPILTNSALSDSSHFVREAAIKEIASGWWKNVEIEDFLQRIALNDPFERKEGEGYERMVNPRRVALEAILSRYLIHPKTLDLLRDRATNDPDEQLREWAQEQLKIHDAKTKMEASSNG